MEEKVLFSVVMPVYGVEQHLEKAVESVLAQTEKDFEIVLVDDASPDNCPAICDRLAREHENIRAVHHEINQGLSAARNTGLQYVKGEYVTFMDSDDYVDPYLLQKVKASLQENPADCVVFGMKEEYCDTNGAVSKTYELCYGTEERFSSAEALRPTVIRLEEKTFYGYAWNKFYKTALILERGLLFEKITLIEDITFNIAFFDEIGSLNILNIAPYHYMKRMDGSLTNQFVPDYYDLHRKRISMLLEQYKGWDLCTQEVKRTIANLYARYIFSALQRNCDKRTGMDKKARKAFLEAIYREDLFRELSSYIRVGGYAGILYGALQKKRTVLCLFFGRAIYLVKEKLPILFAAAKQKR